MRGIHGLSASTRRTVTRGILVSLAAVGVATTLAGCGGGLEVVAAVDAPPPPPPVTALSIQLTQTGPATVQVDWSDDPRVYLFYVDRNGYAFAKVMATTLVDSSVAATGQYCYQVSGYSYHGDLLATSDSACIVVAP